MKMWWNAPRRAPPPPRASLASSPQARMPGRLERKETEGARVSGSSSQLPSAAAPSPCLVQPKQPAHIRAEGGERGDHASADPAGADERRVDGEGFEGRVGAVVAVVEEGEDALHRHEAARIGSVGEVELEERLEDLAGAERG